MLSGFPLCIYFELYNFFGFFEADQVQVMKIDMIFHRTHISCVEPLNCLLLTAEIDQDVPNADVLGTTAT